MIKPERATEEFAETANFEMSDNVASDFEVIESNLEVGDDMKTEREMKAFEGGQARDPLLDDKSTLLTESEQSKDARRHDLTHSLGK